MFSVCSNKAAVSAIVLASAGFVPAAFAADQPDSKVGTVVTITGCVHAAQHANQYLLVGVTEKLASGQVAPVPYAIYLLDSSQGLKAMVGEMADVTGTVVKKEAKAGTIKVDVKADADETTDVRIETASKGMKTKDFPGAPDEVSSLALSRPVYRINVEAITLSANQVAGGSCK